MNKKTLLLSFILLASLFLISSCNTTAYVVQDTTSQQTSTLLGGSFRLYYLRTGESVIVKDKQVKLVDVNPNKEVTVSVDGVVNTIALNTKKIINGLDIRNNYVYFVYTDNLKVPSSAVAWLNIRTPPKPNVVGCKIDLLNNVDLSTGLSMAGLNDVNTLDITPAHLNGKIRLTKVKDFDKTDVYTKEAWIYNRDSSVGCIQPSNSYGSLDDCDASQSGIIYTDIKDGKRVFFESLSTYEGSVYINC